MLEAPSSVIAASDKLRLDMTIRAPEGLWPVYRKLLAIYIPTEIREICISSVGPTR
jgi:hypothetical protein